MKPRVLFVGRTRYRLPLATSLARKWDALSERMDVRVLASGTGSDPRFRARAAAAARRAALLRDAAVRASRASCASFRPDVVVAESPYEAVAVRAGAARWRARGRSSSSRCTATGASRRGSTARARGSAARPARRPARGVGAPPRRRPSRRLGVHRRRSSRELGREPAGVFTDVLRPRRVRGPASCRCRTSRACSSSACSSATRTSTGSRRRGGSSPRRVPEARLHLVGDGTQADGRRRRSRARARAGTAGSSRPRSRARSTRRACAAAAVGVGGPAARSRSRRSCAAAPSSATRGGRDPRHRRGRRQRPARRASATPRRSPPRSSACSTDRELAERLGEGARAASRHAGCRRPRSTPTASRAVVDAVLA